jgi:hypothetical protein
VWTETFRALLRRELVKPATLRKRLAKVGKLDERVRERVASFIPA